MSEPTRLGSFPEGPSAGLATRQPAPPSPGQPLLVWLPPLCSFLARYCCVLSTSLPCPALFGPRAPHLCSGLEDRGSLNFAPWMMAQCPSPSVWLATQNHSTLVTERSAVPFLPVNPEYSATRNQVRGLRVDWERGWYGEQPPLGIPVSSQEAPCGILSQLGFCPRTGHSFVVMSPSPCPLGASLGLSASQGRQKLARFNAREFATLIIDILSEAKRRQQGKSLSSPTGRLGSLGRCGMAGWGTSSD